MKMPLRRLTLIAILTLLLADCAEYTTIELKNFVEGLEENLSKIDKISLYQLTATDEHSTNKVKSYVQKKQCKQDSNDPLIIVISGESVDLSVQAGVDNQAGIVLIAPQKTFGFGVKTGSSASWKIVPSVLSSIPQKVFESRLKIAANLPDKEKTEVYKKASEEKAKLDELIKKLIDDYPSKVKCKLE